MSVFAQTSNNGFLIVGGQLVLVSDPAEQVCVRLRNRLQFWQGEWFLDTRLGTPYMTFMGVKNPDKGVIDRIFRRVILSVPGVSQVLELRLDPITAGRKLGVFMRVQTDAGAIITGGTGAPFIVETR